MLIYSMSVSVDGFIADREGAFGWSAPSEELFRFHTRGGRQARRLSVGPQALRDDVGVGDGPVVARQTSSGPRSPTSGARSRRSSSAARSTAFRATPGSPKASVAEEVAAALEATEKDVEIGGAGLAAAAIELGLVDELRMFRYPVVVGGGTPYLPPVTEDIRLDLIETRTFNSRVIYERYQRVRGVL